MSSRVCGMQYEVRKGSHLDRRQSLSTGAREPLDLEVLGHPHKLWRMVLELIA